MFRNMTSPCFNDYPPTNIIAAEGRVSINFAIGVSFDVKEAAVSADVSKDFRIRPDFGSLDKHLRRLAGPNWSSSDRHLVPFLARQ
jgi:hypothetical protein